MGYFLPLLGRTGEVKGHTIIDDADAAWASQWEWRVVGRPRIIYLHRALLEDEVARPGKQVDHINRDKLDNRRANLRVVTAAQQSQNRPSPRHARSAHRGVTWSNERGGWWRGRVRVNGRVTCGPRTKNELEAAAWARAARAALMTHAED